MVIRMDALFLVDRDARKKQMTGEERLAARRQHAEVWADEIRQECMKLRATVLPKSALGKAITYTLNQWSKLRRCFDYGEVELSNNLAENSMRPVTLGASDAIQGRGPASKCRRREFPSSSRAMSFANCLMAWTSTPKWRERNTIPQ